jgi:hypothetical protein
MSQGTLAQQPTAQAPVEGTQAPIQSTAATPQQPDPREQHLIKKERALTAQMRKFREERDAFEKEKAVRAEYAPKDQWKKAFLEDPTSVGLSYEEIQSRYLTQPTPEQQEMLALRREISALRAEQEKTVGTIQSAQSKAYNDALNQISREVDSLVDAPNSPYELVKLEGANKQVTNYIKATYDEEGIVLSTEEATQAVEDYLLERAEKLLKAEKLKAKLAPPQPQADTQTQSQSKTPSTLTNAMSQASTPLTAKQRRERAIAAFKGIK